MTMILPCYYLDNPLSADERRFVEQALLGPWAKFKTCASSLEEKRVPVVLPLPNENGEYNDTPQQRAELVRHHLQHAGIRRDAGHQVVWIMPRDQQWDAVFQYAIRRETGFGPFVVQRWYREGEHTVRGQIRVIDTQLLLEGLE
jgi:hypothetical protein